MNKRFSNEGQNTVVQCVYLASHDDMNDARTIGVHTTIQIDDERHKKENGDINE
jgi:hypothetical protein